MAQLWTKGSSKLEQQFHNHKRTNSEGGNQVRIKYEYVFLVGTENSVREFRQTMRRATGVGEFLTVKAPDVKKKIINLYSKSTLKNSNELSLLDLAIKDC